jgi:hypothetical protein
LFGFPLPGLPHGNIDDQEQNGQGKTGGGKKPAYAEIGFQFPGGAGAEGRQHEESILQFSVYDNHERHE